MGADYASLAPRCDGLPLTPSPEHRTGIAPVRRRLLPVAVAMVALVLASLACGGSVEQCPSEAEVRYFEDVSRWVGGIGEQLIKMGELSAKASDNMAVLRDERWRADMRFEQEMLLGILDEIEATTPPPRAQGIHRDLTNMAADHRAGVDKFRRGMDPINNDLLLQAAGHIGEATRYINAAVDKIVRFCD